MCRCRNTAAISPPVRSVQSVGPPAGNGPRNGERDTDAALLRYGRGRRRWLLVDQFSRTVRHRLGCGRRPPDRPAGTGRARVRRDTWWPTSPLDRRWGYAARRPLGIPIASDGSSDPIHDIGHEGCGRMIPLATIRANPSMRATFAVPPGFN